jgi:hypothetical protein
MKHWLILGLLSGLFCLWGCSEPARTRSRPVAETGSPGDAPSEALTKPPRRIKTH